MTVGDHLAVQAAFPLPQVNLAQARLDSHQGAAALGKRCRSLSGAPQRRYVNRVNTFGGQTRADQLRLNAPLRRKRRVTVPVDQREHLAVLIRLRLTVPHDYHLYSIGRKLEPALLIRTNPCLDRHKTLTVPAMHLLGLPRAARPRRGRAARSPAADQATCPLGTASECTALTRSRRQPLPA